MFLKMNGSLYTERVPFKTFFGEKTIVRSFPRPSNPANLETPADHANLHTLQTMQTLQTLRT
jgi:hypothetical protein